MSIRLRLFLVIFSVCVLCAALYEGLAWYAGARLVRRGVDAQLMASAHALNAILPPDYQDRAVAGKISSDEFEELKRRMLEYTDAVGVTFLYTLVEKDGKVCFTMDDEAPIMGRYKNPLPTVFQAFQEKKSIVGEGDDIDFGVRVRSALIYMVSPEGMPYLVGADVNVSFLRDLFNEGVFKFAMAMTAGAVLALVLAFTLSHYMASPMITLAAFAREMAAQNFPPEIHVPKKLLPKNENTSNEIAYLALSFQNMLDRLDVYLKNFEQEVAARERVENEFKIAGEIQANFLPPQLEDSAHVSVSAFMKPAKEAGGDLYEYFYLDSERLCFAIGDVSGKGMPAALFMARAMTLVRPSARATGSLAEVSKLMNGALCRNNERCMFLTFFIGVLEISTGALRFVNCGHNPPVLREKDGTAHYLKSEPSPVLGIDEDADFEIHHARLEPDQTLLLYTDGVTEAIAVDDSFYGEDRLLKIVGELPVAASTEETVHRVVGDLADFAQHCPQADDITLLCIRRR